MIVSIKPLEALLKYWEAERFITPLDRHFALTMAQFHQQQLTSAQASDSTSAEPTSASSRELFLLICALLSRQLSQQHTCLPIRQLALDNPLYEQHSQCQLVCSHEDIIAELPKFSAVSLADQCGPAAPSTPLILDGEDLYLQRYFQYESEVSAQLIRLANSQVREVSPGAKTCLDQLFPSRGKLPKPEQTRANTDFDWQKIATATALTRRLAVITGGPGTGKTTTVTKLLYLLTREEAMTIRLVAPTGKAAARLSESIKASKQRLKQELDPLDSKDLDCLQRVPEEASTLHRLLGVVPNSHRFRHHRGNPLRLDLLVIDEASMVDLPMMHKLLSALPPHASLILLGDQDQLASVEAGAVLADICSGLNACGARPSDDRGPWQMRYSTAYARHLSALTNYDLSAFISQEPKLGDSLCMLTHSHRFQGDAGIGQLARAVNYADLKAIKQVWRQDYQELRWLEHQPTKAGNSGLKELVSLALSHYRQYFNMLNHQHKATEIIDCYNTFRILCAMRAGEYGVDGINQSVTYALKQAHLITNELEFYPGRPVMIQSNDYNLGLFNGDIGLILADHDQSGVTNARLMAHFIQADGSVLKILPARLPQHETCFAMTVHKSQGSEFTNVALVLPLSPTFAQQQLLTKELLYTAITRARHHFTCLSSNTVFQQASLQATQRASGLARRLWH